jgi:hypothetical protein
MSAEDLFPKGEAEDLGQGLVKDSIAEVREKVLSNELPKNLPIQRVLLGMASEIFTCVYGFAPDRETADELLNEALVRGQENGAVLREAFELMNKYLKEDNDEQ